MKNLTTEQAVIAYTILKNASLKGVDNLGKFAVIKLCKELKSTAVSFEEFKNDAIERLKPENLTELQKDAEHNEELAEFSKAVNACVSEELNKQKGFDFTPLSKEQFEMLIGANEEWSVEQMIFLEEVVTE